MQATRYKSKHALAATLVGITFVGHQFGSFLGIWLGGVIYDRIGNYDPIFWGGVVLGLAAAFKIPRAA